MYLTKLGTPQTVEKKAQKNMKLQKSSEELQRKKWRGHDLISVRYMDYGHFGMCVCVYTTKQNPEKVNARGHFGMCVYTHVKSKTLKSECEEFAFL